MDDDKFDNFLKIAYTYNLKKVVRNTPNNYFDEKSNLDLKRMETTAEHVYSSLKLADYFLTNEEEFKDLDRLKVYELLMYHDDVEIETGDVGVSEIDKRVGKKDREKRALPVLALKYPKLLDEKVVKLNDEYDMQESLEAKFVKAVDKIDAIVHCLEYKKAWGLKGFDEENTRKWFGFAMEYSRTFQEYFERLILFLRENGYFEK